jgi:hypothetical protein
MRFLSSWGLLGVEGVVSVRVQSGTNVKNNESWEKALFERAVISSEPKALTTGQSRAGQLSIPRPSARHQQNLEREGRSAFLGLRLRTRLYIHAGRPGRRLLAFRTQ